ncbi:transposase [Endozoicomonas gorgoniicola]|uniref:Transposase n=1 Tax=Endozoicomonas gorgoniicola TaxID=1234144 RepID=A0ABT3MTG3_9GAMM|nr:transposase [Endozoicomonas gorgoniicola]MCW7552638.1 transposase [Endozoicomonas gorgoniicola]
MHLPDSLFSSTDNEQLRSFVKNLLDTVEKQSVQIERQRVQIEQLVEENEQLRAEIRHLKKHKGKPKIRPNVSDKGDDQEDSSSAEDTDQAAGKSDTDRPPKSKRPRSQEAGETAAPPMTVDREEICSIAAPGENWRFKCYIDFFHTELDLRFVTTRYRREYYTTPEGGVSAPLPDHVKDRFGDNLKAHLLDFYHSCSTTQPLLLSWLHDHGCSISEGSLSNILTKGHDIFHQEKEELLEAGLTCSDYLQADDTGARHQGKNGYCLFIGNPYFSYFHSSDSKSRINFLGCLQGQQRLYLLNDVAIDYMENQVDVSKKWITALSECGEKRFSTEEEWESFLNSIGCAAPQQRRWATEGVLKAALMLNHRLENLIIHSDGARQFDTAFQHSLCWYHAGRNMDKLIPANDLERAARDTVQDQYWCLYDDIEAYQKKPTDKEKQKLYQEFDRWVTQRVDYPALQAELGKLMVVREELLLVLEYPWLPLHNNLSERQIREYVKRRKVGGGTRSKLGRKCRDTFASLKKTCKQHGVSFANYLRDRLTGTNLIPQLGHLILKASGYQETVLANGI